MDNKYKIIGALTIVVVLVSVLSYVYLSNPNSSANQTNNPTPTATPNPTQTPTSTDTPAVTATPKPTTVFRYTNPKHNYLFFV